MQHNEDWHDAQRSIEEEARQRSVPHQACWNKKAADHKEQLHSMTTDIDDRLQPEPDRRQKAGIRQVVHASLRHVVEMVDQHAYRGNPAKPLDRWNEGSVISGALLARGGGHSAAPCPLRA